MNGDHDPVTAEHTFDVPIATLWQAITQAEQMRQWFFAEMKEFEPKEGFETEFVVVCEGRDFPHVWKITEVVPDSKIVYQWSYRGYPGDSTVTWDLTELPKGTHLKVTHKGQETFAQDDPIFSRESGQAGWDYFINESLPAYLDEQKG
ncbi:MAG: SRPBCC domain-containing protein [Pirellulaceae bacterium]|nr:SRPBCC domain-containing protein [Pirellulaceae bacterium]